LLLNYLICKAQQTGSHIFDCYMRGQN